VALIGAGREINFARRIHRLDGGRAAVELANACDFEPLTERLQIDPLQRPGHGDLVYRLVHAHFVHGFGRKVTR
jgi:hypothetical protein